MSKLKCVANLQLSCNYEHSRAVKPSSALLVLSCSMDKERLLQNIESDVWIICLSSRLSLEVFVIRVFNPRNWKSRSRWVDSSFGGSFAVLAFFVAGITLGLAMAFGSTGLATGTTLGFGVIGFSITLGASMRVTGAAFFTATSGNGADFSSDGLDPSVIYTSFYLYFWFSWLTLALFKFCAYSLTLTISDE